MSGLARIKATFYGRTGLVTHVEVRVWAYVGEGVVEEEYDTHNLPEPIGAMVGGLFKEDDVMLRITIELLENR